MLARMRPESKIRHCTVGPADQKLLPLVNQSLALTLSNPAAPVRKNFGNKSALATPMLAVAAASCRSATCTSGRRRSNSEGSPTGTTGGAAGMGAATDNSAVSASGCWPNKTPSR